MARRIRHHRRGHAARKWMNLAGKAIGGLVIATPAFAAWKDSGSDLTTLPNNLLHRYTGYSNGTLDVNMLGQSAGAIAGGVILIKVFSWLSKRF